jgi:hypothetical protein
MQGVTSGPQRSQPDLTPLSKGQPPNGINAGTRASPDITRELPATLIREEAIAVQVRVPLEIDLLGYTT